MYLIKIFKSIKEVIILLLLNPILLFIISIFYAIYDINNLNFFINNYGSIIILFSNTLYLIYLIKNSNIIFKKYNVANNYPYIYLFISIPIFLNSLILLINPAKEITTNIYLSIIGTIIIGPILEEIIFRYILYNKLCLFNNKKVSIILTTIIFSLLHNNFINILYAFIIGFILTTIYSKRNNIKEVIVLHAISNAMSLLINKFDITLLIVSLISTIFSFYLIKKENYL